MNGGKNPILKTPRIKNKKTLDSAKGQDCIKCSINNETTVSAHYSGLCQARLGKGMGGKLSDILTAWLCHDCHRDMDLYKGVATYQDKVERSDEFLFLIFQTINLKIKLGLCKMRHIQIPDSFDDKVLTALAILRGDYDIRN